MQERMELDWLEGDRRYCKGWGEAGEVLEGGGRKKGRLRKEGLDLRVAGKWRRGGKLGRCWRKAGEMGGGLIWWSGGQDVGLGLCFSILTLL